MEPFGTTLGALGSIASLVSLLLSWRQRRSWALPIALFLVFVLTATSSYLSYKYFILTRPVAIKQAQRQELQGSIRSFLANYPAEPSYWDPGQNEGIVKSGLIILEMNSELFPDTYRKIKSDVDADIAFAQQHRDQEEQRQALNTAAQNVYLVLKALSGGGGS